MAVSYLFVFMFNSITFPDEIKPMVDERAEGVLRKLRNWGLNCLLSRHGDSDTESDDEIVHPDILKPEDLEGNCLRLF